MIGKKQISIIARFTVGLVIIGVILIGSLAVFWLTAKKPAEKAEKEVIVTDMVATESAVEIVEQLRESTTSIKPEMVTERLTIDPADGNVVKIADRKLTVKKDNRVWEFSVTEDAAITKTVFPASVEGGQFPKTEKINLGDLKVGEHIIALLERDNDGKIVSRQINVLQPTP